jgi:GNAT superfamily N-acetyltransferase
MACCAYCENKAQVRDRRSGQVLCLAHARFEVVAAEGRAGASSLAIRPSTADDVARIVELTLHFWDETNVDCFDRAYDVVACPAYVACDGGRVVGVASYAREPDRNALVLIALGVLPEFQGRGAGWALLDAVRDEAARRGLERVLVDERRSASPGVVPAVRVPHHGSDTGPSSRSPWRGIPRLCRYPGSR